MIRYPIPMQVHVIWHPAGDALCRPLAERIYLTDVQATLSGDTRFPDLAPEEWRELECSTYAADADHAYAMTFRTLERRHT